MKYHLEFENLAKQELFDAYLYYENKRHGLGENFLFEIRYQISIIQSSPDLFPKFSRAIRKAVVRRFPYIVFYEIFEELNLIAITGIYHSSRRAPKFSR